MITYVTGQTIDFEDGRPVIRKASTLERGVAALNLGLSAIGAVLGGPAGAVAGAMVGKVGKQMIKSAARWGDEAVQAAESSVKIADKVLDSAKKGEGLFGGLPTVAKESLNASQLTNLKRFQKKLPASSKPITLHKNGADTVFQGVVPGKVPGSKAVYEKVVDSAGKTKSYTKTTYAPDGSVVHIKNKVDGSIIVPE